MNIMRKPNKCRTHSDAVEKRVIMMAVVAMADVMTYDTTWEE